MKKKNQIFVLVILSLIGFMLNACGPNKGEIAKKLKADSMAIVQKQVYEKELKGETIWTDDKHGYFIDTRDKKKYKVVKIGNLSIMAENLAYKPTNGNFGAYKDNPNNVTKYGYLYDWETANKIAPVGWHLPAKEEWDIMIKTLGAIDTVVYKAVKEGGSSGFNALMGGYDIDFGNAVMSGANAPFWSATPSEKNKSWYFNCQAITNNAYMYTDYNKLYFSVRLFQN
jgi:uncharacterized protein (TIGR02145 family)